MAVLSARFKLIDEMSESLDRIARSGEVAVQRLRDIHSVADTAFSVASSSADGAAIALDNFERETVEVANATNMLTSATEEVERGLEQSTRAVDQAAEQLEQFCDTSERASQQVEEFGESSTGAIQQLSQALAAAGIIKAMSAIHDAFARAVSKAADFESEMSNLAAITGVASDELVQMSAGIRQIATDSGIALSEISSNAKMLAEAGGDVDLVMAQLAHGANLAQAAQSDMATTLDFLGSQMKTFGIEAGNTQYVADSLALVTSYANLELTQLSEAFVNMGGSAAQTGMSINDVNAIMIAFSEAGLKGGAAGTSLNAILRNLSTPTDKAAEALAELNIELYDNTGASRDMLEVMADVENKLDGMTDSLRNRYESVIFDSVAQKGWNTIVDTGVDSLRDLSIELDDSSMAFGGMGQSAGMAATQTENLNGKIALADVAAENLAVAFGKTLTPTVGVFVDAGRGALEWFTGVVEKYPLVSAGLTAVAVGVGIVATAITVFSLVTSPLLIGAITAITAAMAANPIFLIITGVVALTAAVTTLGTVLTSQKSEYDTWTASAKKQYDELQRLNAEYETAISVYGETSSEALSLRYEVDELSAAFESGKVYVEQFVAECDGLVTSHNKLVSSYTEATEKIDSEAQGTMALIHKLDELGSKTEITAAEQEQMKAIIEQLNMVVPDLALNYSDVTSSLDTTIDSLQKMAQEQANQEKQAENYRTYIDLLKEQTALEEKLAVAEANLTDERERRGMFYDELRQRWTNGLYLEDSPAASWFTDLDAYGTTLSELQTAYDENIALQERLTKEMGEYAQQVEDTKVVTIAYGEAVSYALNSVQAEMDELAAKYDEAYEAARNSIDGVIGLFDTMKIETKLSIDDMTAALQSQTEYLAIYTENLRKASEYGLDDGLISSLSDGSKESAGQLDVIINKIEELGSTTQDAANFVANFNDQFSEVQTAKDEFAATVAEMQADFSAKMDEMEIKLAESIANMNMETEAAAAAKDTMQSYIESIRTQQADAVSAAEAVANATVAALNKMPSITGKSSTASSPFVRGYATGTESAERGLALVGEEGPELIDFSGGEKVYTASETKDIMAQQTEITMPERAEADAKPLFYLPKNTEGSDDANTFMRVPNPQEHVGKSEKKITLAIEGSGAIQIDNNANEESVLKILLANLRPALLGLMRQEIFEEGDLAYDY